MMFGLLSLKPEYAQIVKPFIALAPVTTVGHIQSTPLILLSKMGLPHLLRLIGGEFLERSLFINELIANNCGLTKWSDSLETICTNIAFRFSGYEPTHLNISRIPVYLKFYPSSASTWEIAHWTQLINSKRFAQFDYGSSLENIAIYGQSEAPDFPLENIPKNTVIALIRSRNDHFSSFRDQEKLIQSLKQNGIKPIDYMIPNSKWTHLDYIFGTNTGLMVYDKVIEILDQFNDFDDQENEILVNETDLDHKMEQRHKTTKRRIRCVAHAENQLDFKSGQILICFCIIVLFVCMAIKFNWCCGKIKSYPKRKGYMELK